MNTPEPDKAKERDVQQELGIPAPSPIPLENVPGRTTGTYIQYNYNVNNPTVQLPSSEEFSKYPADVREFWMRASEKEQAFRHSWIDREQTHRHQYDQHRLTGTFDRQKLGQILGAILSSFCITVGASIVIAGANPWGFAAIVAGIVPLVGMAIYAKNSSAPKMQEDQDGDHGR